MAKSGRKSEAGTQEVRRSLRSRAVSELLPAVGGAAFRRFGFVQSSVVSRWREIVGERYAGISAPESIRFPHGGRSDGMLTVLVEGAHAPMMQHVAPEIMERVNRFFGYCAVARIHFRQSRIRPPSVKPAPAPPPDTPLSVELGDSLRAIVDPELRACLEALARGVGAGEGASRTSTIKVMGKLRK